MDRRQRIRPIAIGRNNWLFAGGLRAGKRAAATMSLVRSARLNGHDPDEYLRDVMERLPTQRARHPRAVAASLERYFDAVRFGIMKNIEA